MTGISTHVLDTARGLPAANVAVRLERQQPSGEWRLLGEGTTDADGRCGQLLSATEILSAGNYRLSFATDRYFAAQQTQALYPLVQITFAARAGETHFHVPLLLSPNGYTTYRGT